MPQIIVVGGCRAAPLSFIFPRRIGASLACLASILGLTGGVHAQDRLSRKVAQAPAHGMASHGMPDRAGSETPRALPETMPDPGLPGMSVTPRALASPPPSLADFERIAMTRNPTLRQAAAQVDATRSRSYQAGLYPNPTVGFESEQMGAPGPDRISAGGLVTRGAMSPGETQGGFVRQEIVTGGKLRLSRAKYAEETVAAQFQAEAQRLRVLNGVRTRYFEVIAAERLVAIHRELVGLNDEAVGITDQLVNVGQANEPDLLQAKVEARRARVALRNAENHYREGWESLVTVVGAPELRPTTLDAAALEAVAAPIDFASTLINLLRRSPEIHAALSDIRRSQITVKRERVEPIPNVTVQALVGRNYEIGMTTAGVQASIPLPVFNRNWGTIREAQADLARDHGEHDRLVLTLRQRLADTLARHDDARQSVEDFRAETLPLAKRAFEVQSANYRQRRAAYPQVLVAQRTYVELSKEYVQSLLELRRAEVEINGMLLTDGLAAPGSSTSQGHIESTPQPR